MPDERPEKTPQRKNGSRPTPPNGGLRVGRGVFGWVLFVLLAVMVFVLLSGNQRAYTLIELSDFQQRLERDQIKTITIEGDEIRGEFVAPVTLDDGREISIFRTAIPTGASSSWSFTQWVLEHRKAAAVDVRNTTNLLLQVLIPLIPWLLIIAFLWFFVFRQLRNAGGGAGMLGNFGRSRHRITSKEHTNVTFEDVAGVNEAKEEVQEIVEFLRNPKKFQRLGGRIPRGVLLVGEPGTGKTLLAKAIAGEADVPFFSISGSDFVEMFVGVGASRVRDLFKQAKENSPCIIFLDEIDAVGRRRGSGFSSGGHDEREQTLNAILVEMDGFETNDQVIVCAATNRVDVLDPALTRPGRFDRQIHVPLPDVKGRLAILKVHARKVKLGSDADLAKLAKATPGFSGADLAAIINEAALGATLTSKDAIAQEDLEEARDKVRWGRARKSRAIDEKEKIATAYHEAGHAVVQQLTEDADPIHKVTIIPRGNFGGATMSLPERDRSNLSRKWCIATMKTLFGGRIAEEMFCGDINTGAYADIRQASGLARRMVREWGMNERLGFIYYGDDENKPNVFDFGGGREYSEETAKAIDEEIKKLIDGLYAETRDLLQRHRDRVEAVARALLQHETLDGDDIDRIMRGEAVVKPTVSDLVDAQPPARKTPKPAAGGAEPEAPPGALPAPG